MTNTMQTSLKKMSRFDIIKTHFVIDYVVQIIVRLGLFVIY